MRFFGLKTCDSCKKALKDLAAAEWAPEVIDVRADGVSANDLVEILDQFGENALNRASTTWRNLSDAQKAQPPAELLAEHPTLMKRPVIEQEGRWTLGWKADAKAAWLGAAG